MTGDAITKAIAASVRPIDRLIVKVSHGIGILYEPRRIRRQAEAEAEAQEITARGKVNVNRILTIGEIENDALGQRALKRLIHEESKAQQNMEQVLEGASPYIAESAAPEEMDDDWLSHFFQKCRHISSAQMQDMWSRVLAGEANQPGSFSKRTIEFLGTVSKVEADMFTCLCSYIWKLQGDAIPIVRYDDYMEPANRGEGNLSFSKLSALDSLGLIHFDSLSEFALGGLSDTVSVSYGSAHYEMSMPRSDMELQVGNAILTPMGLELSQIVQPATRYDVMEKVLDRWAGLGLAIACKLPERT